MKDLSASHSLGNLTYKAFNIIPVAGHMKALIPKLTHTLKTHNYVLDKKKKKIRQSEILASTQVVLG